MIRVQPHFRAELEPWTSFENAQASYAPHPTGRPRDGLRQRVLRRVRSRYEAQGHSYGRTFLLTAGLMNLLLILDVFDRCIGRKPLGVRLPAIDEDRIAGVT